MSEKNKTIQEKLQKLSALVAWFQGPDFELEQAIDMYKQAETLANEIEQELTELKNEISVVKKRFDQDA